MLKDKLYNFVVRKNENVRYEYERYVQENIQEHYTNRFKQWKILCALIKHYCIKKKESPLLFWDNHKSNSEQINIQKTPLGAKNSKQNDAVVEKTADIQKKKEFWTSGESESQYFKRPEAHHFVKALIPYDVISFDIFDTLLLRVFDTPEMIFDIMAQRINYPTIYTSFATLRKKCEKECRDRNEQERGHREVTINDIYKLFESKTGFDAEQLVRSEFDVEREFLFQNPYFKAVFDILLSMGKTIIVTSDMYWPKQYIEQFLLENGFNGISKIYVSCEYRCRKADGQLYDIVQNDFAGMKIIHIGDNYASDVAMARKRGFDAKHYQGVNSFGKNIRAEWMSPLVGSAYKGIVNGYFHNGYRQYSLYYEYGFAYGGIYLFGFINWLKKELSNNVDKIIFLARDGALYQKVYRLLGGEIDSDYVLWSRYACMKYLPEMNLEAFLDRVIKHKVKQKDGSTVGTILDNFAIHVEDSELEKYGLYRCLEISEQTQKSMILLFTNLWSEIQKQFIVERDRMVDYLKNIINKDSKIAVVDCGWTGSGPIGFKYFIEKYVEPTCTVSCYMAAGTSYYGDSKHTATAILNGELKTYLFGMDSNRRNEQIHYSTNLEITNNAVFEQFTQDTTPSFRGVGENGEFIFDAPEVENYEITKEIQEGIMDFCQIYLDIFKKDKYMYEISGWDAYRPFAKLANTSRYFRCNFRNVQFSYGFGAGKNGVVETIGHRMDMVLERKGKRK